MVKTFNQGQKRARQTHICRRYRHAGSLSKILMRTAALKPHLVFGSWLRYTFRWKQNSSKHKNKTEVIDDTTFINSLTQNIVSDNRSAIKTQRHNVLSAWNGIWNAGKTVGSKFFTYYAPIEGKSRTGINVVGDFKSTIITNEENPKATIMEFLQMVFDEDSLYLKKMA